MIVTLSYAEIQVAYFVAVQRRIFNMKKQSKHQHGLAPETEPTNIEMLGCAGEMAVAKAFNLYWDTSLNHHTVDVGGLVEVRSVNQPGRRLLIHEKDRSDLPYVLVYSDPRSTIFTLKGWIVGEEGKKEEYVRDLTGKNRPCYVVPDEKLRPMTELSAWLKNAN